MGASICIACRMLEAAEAPLSPPRTAVLAFVSSSLLRSWISISVLRKGWKVDGRSRLADDCEREQGEEGIAGVLVVPDRRVLRAVDADVGVRRAVRQDADRHGQLHLLADGVGGGIAVVAAAHGGHGLGVEFLA